MYSDLTVEDWLDTALNMVLIRKKTQTETQSMRHIWLRTERNKSHEADRKLSQVNNKVRGSGERCSIWKKQFIGRRAYELDVGTLCKEVHNYRSSGTLLYEYNATRSIFSHMEEVILLEVLATIPQVLHMDCTLERLPYLAYRYAREKGKSYPREWDENKQAGSEWQTDFMMHYEISYSFPAKCEILQAK